jgi:hypothetical protein
MVQLVSEGFSMSFELAVRLAKLNELFAELDGDRVPFCPFHGTEPCRCGGDFITCVPAEQE